MALRLRAVPPRQGVRWVRRGLQGFALRPLSFLSLLVGFWLSCLVLCTLLPYVGMVLAAMGMPLLGLGFMIATRSALGGGAVHPGQWMEPLRADAARRTRLLKVCALYALGAGLVMLAFDASLGDAKALVADMLSNTPAVRDHAGQALSTDPRVVVAALVLQAGFAVLSVPFWHAPALVLWGEQGVAQSIFSSLLACWRTKGAFALYGLLWLAFSLLAQLFVGALFALAGQPQLATLAMVPLQLMLTAAFYVSLYFVFVDTFELTEPPAAARR